MSSVDLLSDLEARAVDTALFKWEDDIVSSLSMMSETGLNFHKMVSHFLSKLDDDGMYGFVNQIQCIENKSLKEIILVFYLKIGRSYYRNLFKTLCISDVLHDFEVGSRMIKRTATCLMNEILKVQNCSIEEILVFNDSFLNMLLDEIESERDDDEYGNELLKLLLSIQDQFDSKCTSLPDLYRKINRTLAQRTKSTKTLSENIIFLLNRSLDSSLKMQLLKFIRRILEESKAHDFFYSNDVVVLLDVTLREIQCTDEDNEKMLQELIYLLPLLIQANSRILYKRSEIITVLRNILSSDCSLTLKRIINKTMENEILKN